MVCGALLVPIIARERSQILHGSGDARNAFTLVSSTACRFFVSIAAHAHGLPYTLIPSQRENRRKNRYPGGDGVGTGQRRNRRGLFQEGHLRGPLHGADHRELARGGHGLCALHADRHCGLDHRCRHWCRGIRLRYADLQEHPQRLGRQAPQQHLRRRARTRGYGTHGKRRCRYVCLASRPHRRAVASTACGWQRDRTHGDGDGHAHRAGKRPPRRAPASYDQGRPHRNDHHGGRSPCRRHHLCHRGKPRDAGCWYRHQARYDHHHGADQRGQGHHPRPRRRPRRPTTPRRTARAAPRPPTPARPPPPSTDSTTGSTTDSTTGGTTGGTTGDTTGGTTGDTTGTTTGGTTSGTTGGTSTTGSTTGTSSSTTTGTKNTSSTTTSTT